MEFYDVLLPENMTHEELKLYAFELQECLRVSKPYVILLKHSLVRAKEENAAVSKKIENLRAENKRLIKQMQTLEDFMLERERKLANCMLELKNIKKQN